MDPQLTWRKPIARVTESTPKGTNQIKDRTSGSGAEPTSELIRFDEKFSIIWFYFYTFILFFNLINLISISLSFFLQSLSLFSVSVTPPFHPLKLPFLSPFQTLQSAERKDRLGAPLLSASAFCLGLCIGLNYFRLFCLLAAL